MRESTTKEEDDAPSQMADDDHLDLSSAEDPASGDEETIKGDQDQGHIAEILEEERHEDATEPPTSNGTVANHYRQLLREQDDASDSGSAECLPRRAGSPIDSLLSAPDDTPSIQVRGDRAPP
jgi:vacuolar protein sorting-associated protein 8